MHIVKQEILTCNTYFLIKSGADLAEKRPF